MLASPQSHGFEGGTLRYQITQGATSPWPSGVERADEDVARCWRPRKATVTKEVFCRARAHREVHPPFSGHRSQMAVVEYRCDGLPRGGPQTKGHPIFPHQDGAVSKVMVASLTSEEDRGESLRDRRERLWEDTSVVWEPHLSAR